MIRGTEIGGVRLAWVEACMCQGKWKKWKETFIFVEITCNVFVKI
jgi:hypothetical protein